MESNAFLKSIKRMSAFFLSYFTCFIKFRRFKITLPILFCVIQAFCCLPIILLTAGFILCVMQQDANLQNMLSKLIGLQLPIRVGSLVPFLNNFITAYCLSLFPKLELRLSKPELGKIYFMQHIYCRAENKFVRLPYGLIGLP